MAESNESDEIQSRVEILRESGEFGLDDEGLYKVAEELYDQERRSQFTLTGEEIFQALVTVYKGKSFLRRGKRHIGMAFHPEPGILSMPEEKKKAAIAFITSETFKLEKRDMKFHANGCRCLPVTVGFQWNGDNQFHLVAV